MCCAGRLKSPCSAQKTIMSWILVCFQCPALPKLCQAMVKMFRTIAKQLALTHTLMVENEVFNSNLFYGLSLAFGNKNCSTSITAVVQWWRAENFGKTICTSKHSNDMITCAVKVQKQFYFKALYFHHYVLCWQVEKSQKTIMSWLLVRFQVAAQLCPALPKLCQAVVKMFRALAKQVPAPQLLLPGSVALAGVLLPAEQRYGRGRMRPVAAAMSSPDWNAEQPQTDTSDRSAWLPSFSKQPRYIGHKNLVNAEPHEYLTVSYRWFLGANYSGDKQIPADRDSVQQCSEGGGIQGHVCA